MSMIVPKLVFPHISRKFTAKLFASLGNISLWSLLIALIGLNGYLGISYKEPFATERYAILTKPLVWQNHVALAIQAKNSGINALAQHELLIAQDLFSNEPGQVVDPRVLGVTSTPVDLLESWQEEPEKLVTEENDWQAIMRLHPDYRDGYIKLATLSYARGNIVQAKAYLLKAHLLDPNNELVLKLEKFIGSSGE